MQVLLTVGFLAATIFTLVDAIRIDSSRVRYLDKVFWVIIILIVPLIGMLLWWTIGREYMPGISHPVRAQQPYQASRIAEPLSEEEIDAAVEAEIQRHENEARIRRLERELRDLKGD
jgi:hypothetical protein